MPLEPFTVVSSHGPTGEKGRIQVWSGTPQVREPDKCLEWSWADPAQLPQPMVRYTQTAIEAIGRGETYTELGWS